MFRKIIRVHTSVLLGIALLGLSTVCLGANNWTWYSKDGNMSRPSKRIPNGDCLEMMCDKGCVEKDETFEGYCCPKDGSCRIEGQDISACCEAGFICKNGICQEECTYLFDSSNNDLGCCNTGTLVKDPDSDRGGKGWLFRGYTRNAKDFYGCCPSNRTAGKKCCTSDEEVCKSDCCDSEHKNCCNGTCCEYVCNQAGNACCADRTFGNKSEFEVEECSNKKCTETEWVTRYRWQETTSFKVDSKKNMDLVIDIIGIIDFSKITFKDKLSGNPLVNLKKGNIENKELHITAILLAGHTYDVEIDLTNACGGSCNITARCQK